MTISALSPGEMVSWFIVTARGRKPPSAATCVKAKGRLPPFCSTRVRNLALAAFTIRKRYLLGRTFMNGATCLKEAINAEKKQRDTEAESRCFRNQPAQGREGVANKHRAPHAAKMGWEGEDNAQHKADGRHHKPLSPDILHLPSGSLCWSTMAGQQVQRSKVSARAP